MTPFERALVGELEGSHGDRVHVGDVHGATALHHYAGLNSLADVELLITGWGAPDLSSGALELLPRLRAIVHTGGDRKSTRLNSSHVAISYAVFCLKKKNVTPSCGFPKIGR